MASQATAKYTVIREVVKDVWTFSAPFGPSFFPMGGRSTAVKMKSGDVWILASTPLNDVTKNKLAELGPVKWIIGCNGGHRMFLGDFKKEYPDAKLIAVDAARKGMKNPVAFDGAWGADPPDTNYGFESDIQHCYFSGYSSKDVAFFHPESKTMIQGDLFMNLPATEQYSKTGSSGRIPIFGGFLAPGSWLQKKIPGWLGSDKEAMRRDVKTTMGWDFERIIPCHGDILEKDAKAAWRAAYHMYLD
ncbi:hypothetical protein EIP91_000467 [Steccherinum ochraceum]|uniref:Metallo-beta-lactamase domain-containing protein n=1 Tax=Steccherinum ochraceum TaxID=92696 RepID=A0A4V2MWQ3_9APHY|nr:hypothetical protein EIP91_000467 [Steccherinum ochraceum]